MPEECKHRFSELNQFDFDGGTAECRDCGMVSDYDIFYDEWMTPEEYDRRLQENDTWWAAQSKVNKDER